MKTYQFLDDNGTFELHNPDKTSYLYFPLANENGVKSVVSPSLSGDFKTSQNTFLLQPMSNEDLHTYKGSRNFWCYIEGKGEWSATGVSAKQEAKKFTDMEEEVTLEAGILWHKLKRTSKELGVSSHILSFIPVDNNHQVEIMKVTIKNISSETITLTATTAIPLYCRSADNIRDHRHVTSLLHRIETTKNGIIVNPTLTFDERGHKKNDQIYYIYGATEYGECPEGFFPTVESFIGEGGSFERPESIIKNKDAIPYGKQIDGYEAMGSIRFKPHILKADQEVSFIIMMGITNEEENIEIVFTQYNTTQKVLNAFEELKVYWNNKQNVYYQTGDKDFNNYMHWVSFQPLLRRIYGCSFLPQHDYGKGGRGWRDLWQDCLSLLIINPLGVRKMLLDNFRGVRIDGTNATIIGEKQGEFKADRNNITRVWMDHGVWPLITTKLYIEQTGDFNILLEKTTYFKDSQISRGEEKDNSFSQMYGEWLRQENMEIYQGTIIEHLLLQNLAAFYDVGEHNHMRLHDADWNDALDMASKRGESVAFSAAYADNLENLAEIMDVLNNRIGMKEIELAQEINLLLREDDDIYEDYLCKKQILSRYCNESRHLISGIKIKVSCEMIIMILKKMSQWIKKNIQENEWISVGDYGWFNGYYDENGRKVEGILESEVRMILTSQVFTIVSKTASEEQVKHIIKAADLHLYQKNIGGYRLNTNFHEVKDDLGRMFGFAYGHKENGAVFSHMVVMYANALYKRGFVKEGFKAIHTLYEHGKAFETSKIYPGIPEYFNEEGRGMYHYLTGAASWYMLTVITEMFGVKGRWGDLTLCPKLLKVQFDHENRASIGLRFADRDLLVVYINTNNKDYGEYHIKEVYLDSSKLEENDAGKYNYNKQNIFFIKRAIIEQLSKGERHEILIYLI